MPSSTQESTGTPSSLVGESITSATNDACTRLELLHAMIDGYRVDGPLRAEARLFAKGISRTINTIGNAIKGPTRLPAHDRAWICSELREALARFDAFVKAATAHIEAETTPTGKDLASPWELR